MPSGESIILIRYQSGRAETKYVDIGKLQFSLGTLKLVILFAHAFTMTDTTSPEYRRGNAKARQLILNRFILRDEMSILYNKEESQDKSLLQVTVSFLPGVVSKFLLH